MSMVRCDECEHLIDSDMDCDCFVDRKVLCQFCREELDDEAIEELQWTDMVKS